jgi:hypothetical protein
MTVNPSNVEKLWADRKADLEAVASAAKAAGAMHHRWAFGDDYVLLIDEWPDAASFHKFFESQEKIADLMQTAGVQGPPEFQIVEAKQGPDQF